MRFGKLVTIDGKLFVDSDLPNHDKPIEVLNGFESMRGEYWFVTEKPKVGSRDPRSFGFLQHTYGWEWGYIDEAWLKLAGRHHVWSIKKIDLPYAGKRGD